VWAYTGVGLTLGLSGWLNGLAFTERPEVGIAGWILGVLVPVLVLVFSRVSAMCLARGELWLSGVGAGAVLAILALSVQHLASSISRLTGEAGWTAALMAVAVDAGLVVCELATVRK
jgi:membrane associated rhomboid family serine protease